MKAKHWRRRNRHAQETIYRMRVLYKLHMQRREQWAAFMRQFGKHLDEDSGGAVSQDLISRYRRADDFIERHKRLLFPWLTFGK